MIFRVTREGDVFPFDQQEVNAEMLSESENDPSMIIVHKGEMIVHRTLRDTVREIAQSPTVIVDYSLVADFDWSRAFDLDYLQERYESRIAR